MVKVFKRRCYKCGKTKPILEFRVDRRKPHGRGYECRECACKSSRDAYKKEVANEDN